MVVISVIFWFMHPTSAGRKFLLSLQAYKRAFNAFKFRASLPLLLSICTIARIVWVVTLVQFINKLNYGSKFVILLE